jgi:formate--tetrahydrofolate ligase
MRICELAEGLGLPEQEIEPYGRYVAKVRLSVRERLSARPNGRYIVVTAMSPTPHGEGKTVTTLGLAQALQRVGARATACIRQPSLGPTFGAKGGGAGGGAARVEPFHQANLHLTGDFHAVAAAHNLLAATVDAHLYRGNAFAIDPHSITLRRVLDVDDRALRHVVIGLGGAEDGVPRETGFEITAASEVMAILALATSQDDLRARLGRMVVGFDRHGAPVTAEQLQVAGAMAALLLDALRPNLLQTGEHTPVFMHAGPFGNIAHGCSSVVADQIALKLAEYVVTEAGFGADLGLEKFMHIKCRTSGLTPDCVVLVATVQAVKWHGGAGQRGGLRGRAALERGCANLTKQIANAAIYGLPVVVAVNHFPSDTPEEIAFLCQRAIDAGAAAACESRAFAEGGAGATDLATAVMRACERTKRFHPLYAPQLTVRDKLDIVARRVYGAKRVSYGAPALAALERVRAAGLEQAPVCIAKTHMSLSHDPKLIGAPSDFVLPVRDVRISAGAGFVYALCGEISTMPGLPSHPAYESVDVCDGSVVGLR